MTVGVFSTIVFQIEEILLNCIDEWLKLLLVAEKCAIMRQTSEQIAVNPQLVYRPAVCGPIYTLKRILYVSCSYKFRA